MPPPGLTAQAAAILPTNARAGLCEGGIGMPSIFRRPNPLKILKIVLGCCAAYAAASLLGLRHAASSVTITLLSIQDTRRSTFRLAATRCCAFLLALA